MVARASRVKLVLHIITRTNIGGVSNYVMNLVAATEGNVRHVIVRGTPSINEGDFFATHPTNVRFINVASLHRSISPWREVLGFASLLRIIRAEQPDVVHTHMAKAGVLGRIAAWICRVPIRIHTFHGHLLDGYFSPRVVHMIVFLERVLQRITTWSITNGEKVRQDLIHKNVLSDRTSVSIPPAVNPFVTASKSDIRTLLALPSTGVIVGFVGRLAQVKRPDRFVSLAQHFPDTSFVMFGDGPLGDFTRLRAKEVPNLSVKGWVTDPKVIYAAIDVLVLTSDNEAAAIVLIEAALAELPVIAMNVGSVSEVVVANETGLLVHDEQELVTVTQRLLEDPSLRRRLGTNARRRAEIEFSRQRLAERHLALYCA